MKKLANAVRLPSNDNSIAPVMILDAHGQVVRVVSAAEFQRSHPKVPKSSRFPAPSTRRRGDNGGQSNEADGDISAPI